MLLKQKNDIRYRLIIGIDINQALKKKSSLSEVHKIAFATMKYSLNFL